ncbi:FadR/GntR family transcriptional regulator [Undibacterium sp. Di24W]|uniref:FadR/GntR family transcriptional regulator n=1 Tax=Undibacterium sp. Di24W TaxID=3413033 RepID=UPI003BF06DF9
MTTEPLSTHPIPVRSKPRNLATVVVEHLTARIKSDDLKVGEKLLTESEIMQVYGVSRTVVREAISQLKAAGLVETRHGIGTFVLAPSHHLGMQNSSIITVRDVLDVLEVRISLETEAAWHAATRRTESQVTELRDVLQQMRDTVASGVHSIEADVRFHLLIARATGNQYFVELLGHLGHTLIPRARLNTAQLNHDDPGAYLSRVQHEHEAIFNAILGKDPEAARAAMRTHLSNSWERLRLAQEAIEGAKA